MEKKILLAAMALPCMFAACTQEELVSESVSTNEISANGIKGLKLNLVKETPAGSRADWDENHNKITFEANDMVSMYWLDKTDGNSQTYSTKYGRNSVVGKFNSIFRTTDGESFTSQSMVFEGGNIAVFPADVTFYEQGDLFLNVPATQDVNTIEKVPYISNQLYIQKKNGQTEQIPGYYGDNSSLTCPVKMAANVLNLSLNLENIPDAKYDFEIQSVELVGSVNAINKSEGEETNNGAFATKSNITTLDLDPTTKGEVDYINGLSTQKSNTIVAQVWSTPTTANLVDRISTTAITLSEDGTTATARFVILPTEKEVSGGQIIIRTNCGTITLNTGTGTGDNDDNIVFNGEAKATIDATLKSLLTSQTSTSESSKFYNEKIGKTFNRSIAVDIEEAVLDDSNVSSSADIIRYAGLYTELGKTDDMNLNLVSENGLFDLTKAAVDAIEALNPGEGSSCTLTPSNGVNILFSEGGEVYNIPSLAGSATVTLSAGKEWTMDDALVFNSNITDIINNGTLEVRGTKGSQQNTLNKLTNNGTLNIGGNGLLLVKDYQSYRTSILNIGENQEFQFTDNRSANTINGTINLESVSSMLTVKDGISVVSNAVINNAGTIASGSSEGFTNSGTIEVTNENAITYVQSNASGTIVLFDRDDEVKVQTGEGKIVYTVKPEETTSFNKNENDKFTYVKVNSNVNSLNLASENSFLLAGVSFEFNGVCTLTADNISIYNLIVNSNANLRLNSGNSLFVNDITNKGTITIGGEIIYKGDANLSEGRVLSVGSGAIRPLNNN